jgi:hypothetical protein
MSENRVSVLGELFITQYGHAAMGYGTGTINDAQYDKAHESLFRYVRNLERSINNTRPIEDALQARAEKAEAMVEKLIEAGSMLIETFQDYPDFEEYPEVGKWDTLVAEWKEREK